jgi:pilus assembly protein CpaE
MPEKLSILIVSGESEGTEMFKRLSDVEVVAVSPHDDGWPDSLRKQTPDVLVIELSPKSDLTSALSRIERLKVDLPDLCIFAQSSSKAPELIISAMRAGAQEFLTRPINEHELSQAIERARRRKEQITGRGRTGRLITLFSKTGGTGVTTLAVNLGIALAQVSKKRAALVELNLQHGDAASFLDLNPRYSIVDTCESGDRINSDKLQSCMIHHTSGLSVLPEPSHPAASDEVSAHQVQQILLHLRSIYPYVVVDTPHVFEPRTMAAMDLSDIVVLMTVATIASIRAAKKVLGLFQELGYSPDKVKLVVNRVGRADRIDAKELRETLNYSTFFMIPNNYRAAVDAINSGVPLASYKRLSNVAKSIIEMAGTINRINQNAYPKQKTVTYVPV